MVKLKVVISCLCALVFPSLLFAQTLECRFERECIEFESCEETNYAVAITHKDFVSEGDNVGDHVDYTAEWVDDAVTRKVIYRQRPDFGFVMWAENDAEQFGRMLIDSEWGARYVVQDATVPMMITYFGKCQGGT